MARPRRSWQRRLFRALLALFPFDFRREYGGEMEQDFRLRSAAGAGRGDGRQGQLKLWWELLVDCVRQAPREHLDVLRQDVAHALRLMGRHRGFTAVAVATLALGVGANTAIFSVANATYFRKLPFEDAGRLVRLLDYYVAPDGQRRTVSMSRLNFGSIQEQSRALAGVTAQRGASYSLTGGERPERVTVVSVSPGWLNVHGLLPALGRGFSPEEEQTGPDSGVALISHALWQRRFGGGDVLGQTVAVGARSLEVIGVLPPGFRYPYDAELWIPDRLDLTQGRGHDLNVVARLRAGVNVQQAQGELDRIAERLQAEHPETNAGTGLLAVPLRLRFFEDEHRVTLALLVMVALFLLIACLNVASLLLARFVSRRREVAIRAALGARRGRRFRQFLIESLMLSLLGGVAGVFLALWSAPWLGLLVPRVLRAQLGLQGVELDLRVLGFSFAVSLVAGVVFGTVPALRAVRADPRGLLKDRQGAAGGDRRLLGGLVVAEMALALMLLAAAGTMLRDLARRQQADLGFQTRELLTMQFSVTEERYTTAPARASFVGELLRRVRAVPGVAEAGLTSVNPLCCGDWGALIDVEDVPRAADQDPFVIHHRTVTSGLLEAMQVPLLRGRLFDEGDRAGAPGVVLVDKNMAQRFWPDENPLGKHVRRASGGPWLRVIGVLDYVEKMGDYEETWYLPFAQVPLDRSNSVLHLMVRSPRDVAGLSRDVQAAIWSLDPNLALFETTTMDRMHAGTLAGARTGTVILVVFAVFGMLLASLGIYGVTAYAARQQTQEIGIRMALGARRADVRWLLVRRGLGLVAAGAALGLAGAHVSGRAYALFAAERAATDAFVSVAAAVVLAVVGLVAMYVPARRAAREDPLVALRCE